MASLCAQLRALKRTPAQAIGAGSRDCDGMTSHSFLELSRAMNDSAILHQLTRVRTTLAGDSESMDAFESFRAHHSIFGRAGCMLKPQAIFWAAAEGCSSMTWSQRVYALTIPALLLLAISFMPAAAQTTQSSPPASEKYPALPSEIPDTFTQVTSSFDYEKRDVMIPMRDGVKLHAVIVIPKGAKNAPILLTRTPYNASQMASRAASPNIARILQGPHDPTDVTVEGGYIRVFEDVRGKYGSEGDYVMNRPLHGPLNPTPVDHATDTYDTIDWLVKNLPESNGKVGILGISYEGFTTLMAMFNPHPALKVVVPMNPMVDGWMGDDWFHNGAFREQMMLYFQGQEAARGNGPPGGPHTPTTTMPIWRRVRRARWAVCMDWNRSACGGKCWRIPRTTSSGRTRRSTSFSRHSH